MQAVPLECSCNVATGESECLTEPLQRLEKENVLSRVRLSVMPFLNSYNSMYLSAHVSLFSY